MIFHSDLKCLFKHCHGLMLCQFSHHSRCSCCIGGRVRQGICTWTNSPSPGISGIFTHTSHIHISSSSSHLVCRVHHPSSGNDRCLLDSYGEPKQRREGNTLSAWTETMESWVEGSDSLGKTLTWEGRYDIPVIKVLSVTFFPIYLKTFFFSFIKMSWALFRFLLQISLMIH